MAGRRESAAGRQGSAAAGRSRAEQEQQAPWPDEGLNLRQRLPIDPNGSQCHDVERIVKRGPRKELLESHGIDRRRDPAPDCARLRAGTQPCESSTRPCAGRHPAPRSSSESPASRLPTRDRAPPRPASGDTCVARTGSMSSLSIASSPASSTGKDVRETLRFHFEAARNTRAGRQ